MTFSSFWCSRLTRFGDIAFLLCHISVLLLKSSKSLVAIRLNSKKNIYIFMPSKVLAKNSAEISFPRLHLNYKETRNTSLTSRLTSCKSKTVTHTFRFASPSGQLQQVAAGWCTRKWLRFDQTITNFTSGYLGVLLVVIQLGVTDILCQSDYLTNIIANIFLVFIERVWQIIFWPAFYSYQTAPTCWIDKYFSNHSLTLSTKHFASSTSKIH